jgi:hypothetical protein
MEYKRLQIPVDRRRIKLKMSSSTHVVIRSRKIVMGAFS